MTIIQQTRYNIDIQYIGNDIFKIRNFHLFAHTVKYFEKNYDKNLHFIKKIVLLHLTHVGSLGH